MYLLKKHVGRVTLVVGAVAGDYQEAITRIKTSEPGCEVLDHSTVVIAGEMYILEEVPLLRTSADFQKALGFHEPVSV